LSEPGDVVVLPSDSYYTIRVIASNWLKTMEFKSNGPDTRQRSGQLRSRVRVLLWLETPTNPQLDVCDIRELVQAARAQNVLIAVDNTTAHGILAAAAGPRCETTWSPPTLKP